MGGDIGEMVLIDGNIRQQYLPFVLKPESDLNADGGMKNGPQVFSFRDKKEDQCPAGFGRLNICPSVMRSPEFGMFFNKDISNRLLYGYGKKDPITIDRFLDQLPGMQIRELQVDSKLDQFINLFFQLFQGAKGLFKEFKIKDAIPVGENEARDRWFKMFKDVLAACWNYCTCQGEFAEYGKANIMRDADGNSRWKKYDHPADKAMTGFNRSDSASRFRDAYLLDFPFTMYYRLHSCTTLNIYELPYVGQDMYSSDGNDGWKGKYMALRDITGGEGGGMIGKVLNMVTGLGDLIDRAKINYMPKWDPSGDGSLDGFTVTFDLFNDTVDAAVKNFIFVNTIIPNNLWMQYGMLKHSPCLYDVKIDGMKRLFLCSGAFKVKANGILRSPSSLLLETLCKYANADNGLWDSEKLLNDIRDHRLVKIPDVYTVEMTFSSLIPSNFNNFLFNYSMNSKMETYIGEPAHQDSVIGDMLKGIQSDLSAAVSGIIDKGNTDIETIREKEKREEEANANNNQKK